MIDNNNFFISNLKNVVFFGHSEVLKELIKINKSINLDSLLITSSDQLNKIDDKIVELKIFDKLDKKFTNFLLKKIKIENTLFISIGARYIFKKKLIENFFLYNLVNFHGTRLPLDSGGGGFSWKIMREDRIDNQLVHLVDDGLDTGDIIDSCLSLFPKKCSIPIDFEKYRLKQFIIFYKKFISQLKKGKRFRLKPQLSYLGRYNPRLNTEIDGLINWDMDSHDLYNFINAFDDPYKGASTFLNNNNLGKLYIKKVHLHAGDSSNHPYMTGIVSRHDDNWIVVSTKSKHMLLIEEILNSKGENVIKKIKVGDRFHTPKIELEKSRKKRSFIGTKGLIKK